MKPMIVLCFVFCWVCPLTAGWLNRKAEGWAWYEDINKDEKTPKENETKLPLPPETKPIPPLEELAKVKKDLEEKLAIAILNPTDENVARYMILQKKWINQSAEFSKAWSRLLLQQPELDESVTGFPVSQYGIQLQKQMLQERKENLIRTLVQENGLFFFYEGKSQHSIVFSMIVKEFANRYGWNVMAISVDGVLIDGFNNQRMDNGITKDWGITIFPSLFVVNPQTQAVTPISFGLIPLDQVENNVVMQFSDLLEERP